MTRVHRTAQGSESGARLRSGARFRSRGSGRVGGVYGLQQGLRVGRWRAGRGSRRPAGGRRGTPSRSPARRGARGRRARGGGPVDPPAAAPRRPGAAPAGAPPRRGRRPARRVPGAQVLALAPGRAPERAGPRAGGARAPRESVVRRTPAPAAGRRTSAEPLRALPPPVPQQLGVDREDDEARRCRARPGGPARRPATAATNSARLLARPRPRPRRGRRRSPPIAPGPRAAQRLAVEVRVDGVGGVALQRPQPLDRLPVDRERDRARPRCATGASAAVARLARRTGRCRSSRGARSASSASSARLVGALRQPEPGRLAEAPAVRAQPGVDLQAPPGRRRHQGQHRVRRRRRHQLDPALLRGPAEERRRGRRRAPSSRGRSAE